MWKAIRTNIFVGLILVTPLAVTAFIANWLFKLTTDNLLSLYPEAMRGDPRLEFLLRIGALVVVLFILFLIGVFIRNIIGRRLYQIGDNMLTRIPFINRIYLACRQIIDAFISQRETVFNQAVLVQYPRKGIFSMGFQTATSPRSFRQFIPEGKPDQDYVAVFIPTTPNPTSGWLCFVPKDDVVPLPYTSGDTMKCIISAGVVYPDDPDSEPPPSLIDKLHNLFRREPIYVPHPPGVQEAREPAEDREANDPGSDKPKGE